MTSDDHVSMADIARLSEVKPAAVSNWRRRSSDFPAPVSTSGGERFSVTDVAAWLERRRIPRTALKDDEAAGITYGQRLRRNAGLAEAGSTREPGSSEDFLHILWRELDRFRNFMPVLRCRDLVLGLLHLRVRDAAAWSDLILASSSSHPDELGNVLARAWRKHRSVLIDLPVTTPLEPSETATGIAALVQTLDRTSTREGSGGGAPPAHQLFDFLVEHFAEAAGAKVPVFHTPQSVVRTMLEVVEPSPGERVHDPCCGSGALLTGAVEFVRRGGGSATGPSVSGRAFVEESRKLAAMSLSLHGVDADLGSTPVLALRDDVDQKFDVIVSNPPFSMRDWSRGDSSGDPRWRYGIPPNSNADFAWLQHCLEHLAPGGRAAVLMGNGTTFRGGAERVIRAAMIEDGTVEAVIALPPRLFPTTGVPVSIWLLRKPAEPSRDEVLLVDATGMGRMTERTRRTLDEEEIELIGNTYREFRRSARIADPGFGRAVPLSEIRERDHLLNPRSHLSDPAATVDRAETLTAVREHHRSLMALTTTDTDAEIERQLDRVGLWTPLVNDMSSEWERVPLGEVCDVLSGPGGEALRGAEHHAEGVPVLAPKNIRDNRIVDENTDRLAFESARRLSSHQLAAGDVLCVRTGAPGRAALIDNEYAGALPGTACLRLRPKEQVLTGWYLLYWLGTPTARDWLDRNTLDATVPSLNARTLRTMPIALPSSPVQRAIGEILGSLDDKIALHERIVRTTAELRDSLTSLLGTGTFPLNE